MTHGTLYSYRKGCRCDQCTATNRYAGAFTFGNFGIPITKRWHEICDKFLRGKNTESAIVFYRRWKEMGTK